MSKRYLIDDQPVTVIWSSREQPAVYTVLMEGVPLRTAIEKTRLGSFLVSDAQGRPLGTFPGLRAAVEWVVRSGALSGAHQADQDVEGC